MKRKVALFLILILAFSAAIAFAAKLQRHNATGAAAVSQTITFTDDVELKEFRIHLSAAGGAGNLTITLDSALGAAYDSVLLTQDMTAVTDYVWRPSPGPHFMKDDKIVIAWANAGTKTYGLEVIWGKE